MRWMPTFVLLAAAVAAPLRAQKPTTPDAVPVYPNARVVPLDQLEQPDDSLAPAGIGDYKRPTWLIRFEARHWTVPVAPEAVFSWYRQRLAARMFGPNEMPLEPVGGFASAPGFVVDTYDVKRPGGGPVFPGTEIKRRLIAVGRTPLAPNVWVSNAVFIWSVQAPNGDRTDFELELKDAESAYGGGTPKGVGTNIRLRSLTYMEGERARAQVREIRTQQSEAIADQRRAEMGPNGPSAAELGAPIYPGSRFESDLSAAMSSGGDENYYIYFSADDPAKVQSWFAQKTGKTAQTFPGGAMYAIEGSGMMPKLGVMVQQTAGTAYTSKGKSMITVRKALK